MISAFARSRTLLAREDVSPHMVKWWKKIRNTDGEVRIFKMRFPHCLAHQATAHPGRSLLLDYRYLDTCLHMNSKFSCLGYEHGQRRYTYYHNLAYRTIESVHGPFLKYFRCSPCTRLMISLWNKVSIGLVRLL